MITPGFFGKLPSRGDFVSRGWLGSSRDGLDRVLQQALQGVVATPQSDAIGSFGAPCTLLSWRPGVLGEQGMVLVMLPSADRVGRRFPLCAGVQWTDDDSGLMNWPSIDYGLALIRCLQRCMAAGGDPDSLLPAIVALGEPRHYLTPFTHSDSEQTLPRVNATVQLLRLPGPLSALPSSMISLCSMMRGASDLLGIQLDARGIAQDCLVARRLDAGLALAALFDGCWEKHGWLTLGAEPAGLPTAGVIRLEDDTARPR